MEIKTLIQRLKCLCGHHSLRWAGKSWVGDVYECRYCEKHFKKVVHWNKNGSSRTQYVKIK